MNQFNKNLKLMRGVEKSMKVMKTAIVCIILMFLSVFVIACGGQNNATESTARYQALQNEISRLQRNLDISRHDYTELQDEFNLLLNP